MTTDRLYYETRGYWTLADILSIVGPDADPEKVTLNLDGPWYDVQGIELEWDNR